MENISSRSFWGAQPLNKTSWSFSIWVPDAQEVVLEIAGRTVALHHEGGGHWTACAPAQEGQFYQFIIDGTAYPDPASRQQRNGVHGPSVLADRTRPPRTWKGRDWADAVVFELHIGTFTQEGTLRAAASRLDDLAALGITFVELMPVAQFHGTFGWGYDGVLPYAPHDAYGTPRDLRAFVDRAHSLGMAVLLDVVYNHFGPEGAYLNVYCPQFFSTDTKTPWGPAMDFSRPEVRDYFFANAEMWITEYGFDGLRLDAVHAIKDHTDPHFVQELAQRLKSLDLGRPVHLIEEDERNLPNSREADIDAAWNDDYHHAVHCLLTGESQSYYAAFAVDPMADLCSALRGGQVEQGQPRTGKTYLRGAPVDHLPVTAFVNANQTHDQIGNRAQGERLIDLAGPDVMMVAHALLLTSPYIPMLFMGEEVGSRAPFQYFCDFEGALAQAVREGRANEFDGFEGSAQTVADPCLHATMARSRPYADLPRDADKWRDWTRTLLHYRAERIVPLLKSRRKTARVDRVGAKALQAVWTFEAGTLRIAANMGSVPDDAIIWPDRGLTYNTPVDAFAFACDVTPA